MTSYTITVAPSDGSGSTTTIAVDTSGGDVRITDVHLHATAGLTATQLPSIDINLLMQAVAPQPTRVEAASVAAPALIDEPSQTTTATTRQTIDADDDTTVAVPNTAVSVDDVTAPAPSPKRPRRATRQQRASERPAAEPERPSKGASPRPRRRPRSGNADNTTTTPPQKDSTVPVEASPSGHERAYRRMPDDFSAVATNLNSASAIAEHYNVPRHTAQGWLRRLRTATTG